MNSCTHSSAPMVSIRRSRTVQNSVREQRNNSTSRCSTSLDANHRVRRPVLSYSSWRTSVYSTIHSSMLTRPACQPWPTSQLDPRFQYSRRREQPQTHFPIRSQVSEPVDNPFYRPLPPERPVKVGSRLIRL